jgi:hypothetical protein
VLIRGGGDPGAYQRAVIRWLGRLCLERPDLTVEVLEHALACFRRLSSDPTAEAELRALVSP